MRPKPARATTAPLVLLLCLAALTSLAAAPAAAQGVPSAPPPCGPLAAMATSPANAVAPGAPAEILLTVYNNGTRAAQVVVSISPAPAGWVVTNPEDQEATIERNANAPFTFIVSPTEDATADFSVSFQVGGTCALPAPGVPCPNNACVTTAEPVGALVRLAQPQGGTLPFFGADGLPLEYLVAGVVLVGVAATVPLLLRKKTGGFVADCPEPLKMLRPGRGTSFPIEVRNASSDPVTAQFDIGPVPEGWTAFMPLPEVQLAPKEARSLWLMVRAPPGAVPGDAADLELRLRNLARPDAPGSLVRVRAEVDPNAAEGAA